MRGLTGVWNLAEHNPFFVFFPDENDDLLNIFMSEYSPKDGFGIFKTTKGYIVYTNTYCYNASVFTTGTGDIIGLKVYRSFPMNQSRTLEAAVKRVQVIGLSREYFCVLNKRNPGITVNGAPEFFSFIDQECSKKNEVLAADNERQISFLDEHEAIVKCKQEYEKGRLFSVSYLTFEDAIQNTMDGVVYKFAITEEDEENLAEKFKENTGVEISANDQGLPVLGTIVEEHDGWMFIKFHNVGNSYNRIANTGVIKERDNPEYKYKLEALELLKKGLSPNNYLLSILADGVTQPVHIKTKYTPSTVMEKDGTVHENVNPSQRKAIEKAINVDDFLLVQGPPGTGKTTIITEMIESFVKQGLRVLICSKNNLAVDNVLEKCQGLYYDENNTRKMQCLRLGNEEKVLPAVRQSLARPLTQKIQNDVKARSKEERDKYSEREQFRLQKYDQARENTGTLCWLIKFFLVEKDYYLELLSYFRQSRKSAVLSKKRKESFLKEVVFLIQQCDLMAKQLLALMESRNINVQVNAMQQYLQLTHKIFDCMEMLSQEVESASISYAIIFGEKKAAILSHFENAACKKEEVLRSMCILSEYNGNPVAGEVQIKMPLGELTCDSVDGFQNEVEIQIKELKNRELILQKVLDEWHEELESDQSSLEEPLLRTVKIIGATCIGVNTKSNFKNVDYDVAIVDEAGQITLHDLLVPLVKAKKIILIGDHLQLPPGEELEFCEYVKEKNLLGFDNLDDREEIREYEAQLNSIFSVSLFEKLFRDPRFNDNKVMLDTQFRMHPVIAEFISDNFYEGKYKSGVSAEARTLKISGFSNPIYFIDTVNMQNKYEEKEDGNGYVNTCEAEICAEYLKELIVAIENNDYEMCGKVLKDSEGGYDIGVITAYKKQIQLIKNKTREKLSGIYEPEKTDHIIGKLSINTLDSFQGRDNQIILYSFVRSNKENEIGFLREIRRLNVMMTRAKSLLIMIGDSETLINNKRYTVHDRKKQASFFYKALVEYCKDKKGYIDFANGGLADE